MCVRCAGQFQELLPWLEPLRRDDKTGKLVGKVTDPGQAVNSYRGLRAEPERAWWAERR